MATSKTLTPTNVTIQIPAFTDKPDQRVNSNCIDKEADAINALSDQIAGAIPQNTNLDSLLKQGVYRSPLTISGVATITNCPTDIPFTLIISGDGSIGGTVQTVLTQGHIYTRRASSAAWGAWYDFVGTVVS